MRGANAGICKHIGMPLSMHNLPLVRLFRALQAENHIQKDKVHEMQRQQRQPLRGAQGGCHLRLLPVGALR